MRGDWHEEGSMKKTEGCVSGGGIASWWWFILGKQLLLELNR